MPAGQARAEGVRPTPSISSGKEGGVRVLSFRIKKGAGKFRRGETHLEK